MSATRANTMLAPAAPDPAREAKQMRTVVWVVALALVGLIFDGYDLVVYGAVVLTFLRDPSHLGTVTPAIAGQLGSYALFGVLVGALLAGSVGDLLGPRLASLHNLTFYYRLLAGARAAIAEGRFAAWRDQTLASARGGDA